MAQEIFPVCWYTWWDGIKKKSQTVLLSDHFGSARENELKLKHRKLYQKNLHCYEGGWTLEQVAQGNRGVSIHGDIKKKQTHL